MVGDSVVGLILGLADGLVVGESDTGGVLIISEGGSVGGFGVGVGATAPTSKILSIT